MNKSEIRRLARQIRDDLAREYIRTDVALTATGIASAEHLLTWCREKNIRHIKKRGRWLIHQSDLLEHLG